MNSASRGRSRSFALAPVAMITVEARISRSAVFTRNGRPRVSSTSMTFSEWMVVPKRAACSRNLTMSSGPMIPSGKPG